MNHVGNWSLTDNWSTNVEIDSDLDGFFSRKVLIVSKETLKHTFMRLYEDFHIVYLGIAMAGKMREVQIRGGIVFKKITRLGSLIQDSGDPGVLLCTSAFCTVEWTNVTVRIENKNLFKKTLVDISIVPTVPQFMAIYGKWIILRFSLFKTCEK